MSLPPIKRLGEGVILQTAFSVGDEPIAKMEGMTAFWSKMLETGERTIQANHNVANRYSDEPMEALVYSVGNANELFPSFKVSAPINFRHYYFLCRSDYSGPLFHSKTER